jgi:thiol-disulfide isomerase/thioredoxin
MKLRDFFIFSALVVWVPEIRADECSQGGAKDGIVAGIFKFMEEFIEPKNRVCPETFSSKTKLFSSTANGNPVETQKWPFSPNKIWLIDLWSPNCPPCVAGIPKFEDLGKSMAGSVSTAYVTFSERSSSEKKLINFVREKRNKGQMSANIYVLEDWNALNRTFAVPGIPKWVILDSKGRIAWKGSDEVRAREVIATLKNENLSGVRDCP